MKFQRITLIGVLLLLTAFFCQAGEIVLTDEQDQYFITPNLELFYDSTDALTIQEVLSPSIQNRFVSQKFPYVGRDQEKSYWIRYTVTNQYNKALQSWYFESWGFDIDQIEFYIPDAQNGFHHNTMGYGREFSERELFHKNFLFLMPLKKGETATYYIRLKRSHPMQLMFLIRSHERLIKHMAYEYWYLGIFYGIFMIIIILNIYLYFRVKDKIYLYYLFCVSSEVIYSSVGDLRKQTAGFEMK